MTLQSTYYNIAQYMVRMTPHSRDSMALQSTWSVNTGHAQYDIVEHMVRCIRYHFQVKVTVIAR